MDNLTSFISKMYSGSDEVSSKRVYASLFVILLIVMCIGDQYFLHRVDKYLFTSILTTVLGLCGMNLTAQMKAMQAKKDVASDMVNSTGDNDSAKETMQAANPKG